MKEKMTSTYNKENLTPDMWSVYRHAYLIRCKYPINDKGEKVFRGYVRSVKDNFTLIEFGPGDHIWIQTRNIISLKHLSELDKK